MPRYHENSAELAPRDVVARAIAHELERVKRPDAAVYLDLTHLNAERVRKRCPTIYSTCMRYNADIATELVPVRPAAGYCYGRRARPICADSLDSGAVRRRRSCLHGRARRRWTGQQLPPGRTGVRSARSAGPDESISGQAGGVRWRMQKARWRTATVSPARRKRSSRKLQSLMWQNVGIVREGKRPAGRR